MIRFLEDSDNDQLKIFYKKAYGEKHILNNCIHLPLSIMVFDMEISRLKFWHVLHSHNLHLLKT